MRKNNLFRTTLLYSIVVCLNVLSFSAKGQNYNFNTYSLKDGLIQSNVNSIIQDKAGYMWFATDGGLSKFDGQKFSNYSTSNGLSETSITSICEDNSGNLWIGHSLGKLSVYDGKEFKKVPLNTPEKVVRICHILKENDNTIWLSTVGSGAIKLNPKNNQIEVKSINKNLSDVVYMSYKDKAGKLWFVTDIGVKYYDAQTDSFMFFKPAGFPFFEYSCMTADSDGNLWFGSVAQGIVKYDIKSGLSTQYGITEGLKSNFITAIMLGADNKIWVATWEGGLAYFNGKNFSSITEKNGLSGNKVRSLFIDREGSLWAGMQDKGLAQFKGFRFVHYGLSDGLKNNVVNCIIKDNANRIWFGTNEGIDVFYYSNELELKHLKHIDLTNELRNNLVTSFYKLDNKIYVSTFKGDIGVFDAKSLKRIQTLSINHTLINDLCVFQNKLWIATSTGVTTYNLSTAAFDDIEDLNKLVVMKFFVSSNQKLWIGTRESGLWNYDGKKFTSFNQNNGFNHNSPTSFCEDNAQQLWIGTEGGGLYKKENERFTNLSVKDGILSDYITLLTCDYNNNIWVGTNMGLSKLNQAATTFTKYTASEGFASIETKTNAVFNDSNSIWFGTVNGSTVYNALPGTSKKTVPIVYLTSYEISGNYLQPNENTELSYRQNEISFHFIGLSFDNPTRIKYLYKLEGFDSKWNTAYGINQAVYSHLPPGNYTFKLNACNSEGVCLDKDIEFSFSIIPPLYKRAWFNGLLVILTIALVWAYITFRTRYLRAAKQVLEAQVKERTIEIEQKNVDLMDKNIEIVTKNKEITDSINYAKRIQEAILPSTLQFANIFPEAFILYQPKDIVSGDFYWYADIKSKAKTQSDDNDIYVAVADCTGHGVPGAFMCMIGSSILNQIVQETDDFRPSTTLGTLHENIREVLKQKETETRDGMDIALCHINRKKQQIEYAGALRSLLIYRGEAYIKAHAPEHQGLFVEEIKADKYPIGGLQSEAKREFTNHVIDFMHGDTVYLYTDGYADQFGGPKGKKLMSKKFKDVISSIQDQSMHNQYKHLEKFIADWKEGYDQVDDILVMGIRF